MNSFFFYPESSRFNNCLDVLTQITHACHCQEMSERRDHSLQKRKRLNGQYRIKVVQIVSRKNAGNREQWCKTERKREREREREREGGRERGGEREREKAKGKNKKGTIRRKEPIE